MKQVIRQQYKKIRQQLTPEMVSDKSQVISKQLLDSTYWKESQTIMVYLSFKNEVITDSLLDYGWKQGKTMVIPICQPNSTIMYASQISDWSQLTLNTFGIRELLNKAILTLPPENIDLCLVPGIAFDQFGHRLGFGAGYYDRFLAQLNPTAKKIALAYSEQIHPEQLPQDAYDLPMDHILTDKGWIMP